MRTPASANRVRTRSVAGSHSCSVYLSKYEPSAYAEVSKPSKAVERSIAIRFEARSAWKATA